MNDQSVSTGVAEAFSASELLTAVESKPRRFKLKASWLAVAMSAVIAVCFWILIINSSTQFIRQDLERPDHTLTVLPVQIQHFDRDSWQKKVGILAE